MDSGKRQPTSSCHVVAVPYPGRGHINPMMNLCKLLASRKNDIVITFVVTEEWLGFIGSDTKTSNIQFASIPNVLPSELVRGEDFPGFYEAVMTKMENPFNKLLDQLEPYVTTIIADIELPWATRSGNKRNIPVAALCTFSSTVSVLHHFACQQSPHKLAGLLDNEEDLVDDIQELRAIFGKEQRVMQLTLECISMMSQVQYLLFNSIYELEPQVLDSLKANLDFSIYHIGPAIPYFELEPSSYVPSSHNGPDYLQWLDSQPFGSVLYVSLGSYLSISSCQMDEIDAGLRNSGVRYLWVARGETSRLKGGPCEDKGIVVPWCDQLKVLCHPSICGFWTHCGWNSTLEAVFAGIPMLTFPLHFDQVPNSKQIVENWRIGWKVKKDARTNRLITRDEIREILKRFMEIENSEGKEMRSRAKTFQEKCRQAIAEGGSSDKNLDAIIRDILS